MKHKITSQTTAPSPKKSFVAYWSRDFYNPGKRRVKGAYFSLANSYDQEDIDAIDSLKIGGTWTSKDYGPAHSVTRIA